ncbi:hypothetical protein DL546_000758 [Coniochaeta pulveracea]|uniref:Uncharacterized protein n=1 Tax=Coniochaeta pulveracea TaxID=177199 RepID=A0A420Y0T2_9PEZI|nr:hypothetical protein DL546_000758 [Coniochaeta pulveracea]
MSSNRSSAYSSSGYTGYSLSTMEGSSPTSRSSSAYSKTELPDRTGTYRNGNADGYLTNVTLNTQGKREVVLVQHNTQPSYDPAEPRSSDYHSRR